MSQAFDALGDSMDETSGASVRTMRIEVVCDFAAFRALQGELEGLCNDLCEENVFYEPWMVLPALTHLDAQRHLHFLCFYEAKSPNRLCGFFPLIRGPMHPLMPLRIYQSWHHPHCFRCTPLIRKGCAVGCWEALFDWLVRQPIAQRMLHLRRLPADGEVELALRRVLEARPALRQFVIEHQSAFLRIAPGSDSDKVLRQAMSGNTLGKLRRQQRRLAESGELVFAESYEEPDLNRLLDQFLQLEASGWKGRHGTALACNANEEAFFRAIIAEAKARDRLSFLTMRLDGTLLAGQSSLIGRTGSFLFKTAYDESYSKFSPGVLLEIEHLRRLHDPKDPLRGKLTWSDSCAGPGDGPVYRCWPERRTIREYRITNSFGPGALIVALWPLLRRIYRALHASGTDQPDAPSKGPRPAPRA